jgi:hypothetical protein
LSIQLPYDHDYDGPTMVKNSMCGIEK